MVEKYTSSSLSSSSLLSSSLLSLACSEDYLPEYCQTDIQKFFGMILTENLSKTSCNCTLKVMSSRQRRIF